MIYLKITAKRTMSKIYDIGSGSFYINSRERYSKEYQSYPFFGMK